VSGEGVAVDVRKDEELLLPERGRVKSKVKRREREAQLSAGEFAACATKHADLRTDCIEKNIQNSPFKLSNRPEGTLSCYSPQFSRELKRGRWCKGQILVPYLGDSFFPLGATAQSELWPPE
jgi:hypothetical protein